MKLLREHIIFRSFWLVFTLHILNCSVDTPDGTPSYQPEDLTINDIETIYELIAEKVLGFTNAVPEHDEPGDEDNKGLKVKLGLDFHFAQLSFKVSPIYYPIKDKFLLFEEKYFKKFHPELIPPPPKA